MSEEADPKATSITPLGILVHRCESGKTPEEVKAAEDKVGLGYHYFIDADGQAHLLYPVNSLVWHARQWSRVCVGIAVYGDFDAIERSKNSHPSLQQLRALAHVCISLYHTYGPLPIFGHTDLANATFQADKRCPGGNLSLEPIRRAVFENYALIRAGQHEALSVV